MTTKLYKVGLVRIAYAFTEIKVEADNEDMAQQKALCIAGDYDYEIDYIMEDAGVADYSELDAT